MKLTQNYWGWHAIISNIIILTKRGTDRIHAIIPTKYYKYPSTTILKHTNVLAKVDQLPYGSLPNMTPHESYSITIHLRTVTLSEISHKQN